MRVSALASELEVDPKDIRKFLRSEYGPVGTGGRWDLDQPQVERVRWRFGDGGGGRTPRATGGTYIPPLVRRQTGPGIVDKVRQLQAEPQDIHIKVAGSDEDLVFHRIMNGWGRRGGRSSHVVVLLSNGEFKESKDITEVSSWLLESQYCLIRRGERYYAHHKNYVQALSEVSIPLWLVSQLIERSGSTGTDDTPQELLISDYACLFSFILHPVFILKWEHRTGNRIQEVTLRELWSSKPESPSRDLSQGELALAFSRYFATINLLEEHPQRGEAFEITLGNIFRRFYIAVGERAENLRKDVARAWGFEEYREGWRKKNGSDEVVISNDLRVHINRKFVCIVSAKSSNLPHDDEVARRMLAVATAHRDKIYTIKGETKDALERLFPIGGNGIT